MASIRDVISRPGHSSLYTSCAVVLNILPLFFSAGLGLRMSMSTTASPGSEILIFSQFLEAD